MFKSIAKFAASTVFSVKDIDGIKTLLVKKPAIQIASKLIVKSIQDIEKFEISMKSSEWTIDAQINGNFATFSVDSYDITKEGENIIVNLNLTSPVKVTQSSSHNKLIFAFITYVLPFFKPSFDLKGNAKVQYSNKKITVTKTTNDGINKFLINMNTHIQGVFNNEGLTMQIPGIDEKTIINEISKLIGLGKER